jgi:uncharacterized protein (DUF697 family)
MAGWRDVTNIWKNVREVDLRPIRAEALKEVKIAIVGLEGSGRQDLADQMRRDPQQPGATTQTPILITHPDAKEELADSDLLILMIGPGSIDLQQHQAWAHEWSRAGKDVILFFNQTGSGDNLRSQALDVYWDAAKRVIGPVGDTLHLVSDFVPAVIDLLPDQQLSLARHFPLFRGPIVEKLINETCMSNAAYALSTGLAEVVPVLGIPLNLADMVVLTKAQAFLVYRLGLALGFSTEWQDYITEFGSVIGGGFLWRQLARSLVGLIPVWGIIPKVSVAYAGTYVVGHAVVRWYLTGRHVSPKQIRELYRLAFAQGKTIARNLLDRARRRRLGRGKTGQLPSGVAPKIGEKLPDGQVCSNCGRISAPDAVYCQYCGLPLSDHLEEVS